MCFILNYILYARFKTHKFTQCKLNIACILQYHNSCAFIIKSRMFIIKLCVFYFIIKMYMIYSKIKLKWCFCTLGLTTIRKRCFLGIIAQKNLRQTWCVCDTCSRYSCISIRHKFFL